MASGADRHAADPHTPPPYGARGRDSYPHRPQPDQIYRDRNSSPAERRPISAARKPPLTAGSTGIYAEFVIAVADGGFLRCLCSPHNLAQHGRPVKSQVKFPLKPPARYFGKQGRTGSFGCDLLAPSCGVSKGHDRQRDPPRHEPALEFEIDAFNLTGQPMSDGVRFHRLVHRCSQRCWPPTGPGADRHRWLGRPQGQPAAAARSRSARTSAPGAATTCSTASRSSASPPARPPPSPGRARSGT